MGCLGVFGVVQILLIFLKWGGALDLTWFQVFLPSIIIFGIPIGISIFSDAVNNTTSLK